MVFVTPRRTVLALLATALLSVAATLFLREALADEAPVEGARRGTIHSAILGEEREYFVHLPEGYARDTARRYAVLYVLDGTSQSGHTAESAAILARVGVIPPIIVVGVPSVDGETRNRDYTPPDQRLDTDVAGSPMGEGDKFLAFLERELVGRVEGEVRAAQPRMLAGWSRGGLFVIYAEITRPTLFDAGFAHSPALWREDDRIVGQLEHSLRFDSLPPEFLFLSLGDAENEKMTRSFEHAVDVLMERATLSFRWRAELSEGESTRPTRCSPPPWGSA